MTDDLIERLRAKRHVYPVQGGGDTTGRCYTTDDGYRLINPNGPEAAARIATQQEAIDELLLGIAAVTTIWDGSVNNQIENFPDEPYPCPDDAWEIVGDLHRNSVIERLHALLSKHGERT